MREAHFQEQISRLEKQFGKFGFERMVLLWKAVSDYSDSWFTGVIDEKIGNCRQTPLISDFEQDISVERERIWRETRVQERKDATDFWNSSYHPDEVKHIVQTIRKRIEGKIPDDEYSQFVSMLEGNVKRSPFNS